jgi:hypothetical protein
VVLGKADGDAVYELSKIAVPSGNGYFIAYPRNVGVDRSPLCVCRTWLSDDMTSGPDVADAEAWRELTALSVR